MNQVFEVRDIPEVLERRPNPTHSIITRNQVKTIMEHNHKAIFPVSGDCLEGAQVLDGGWVCIDFTRRPAQPRYISKGGDGSFDICLCYAVFPGKTRPAMMLKEYMGIWGSWKMVGTRYDLTKGKHPYNCCMEAKEILGVVIASWDLSGRLLWKRAPESFSEELGTVPTIHGGNIGDPISLTDLKANRLVKAQGKGAACWLNRPLI